jgi:hypothetical protein
MVLQNGSVDPLSLVINTSNFTNVESQGNFSAIIQASSGKVCLLYFFLSFFLSFFLFFFVCVKAYMLSLNDVSITNSNSASAVNGLGMISVVGTDGCVIELNEVLMNNIKLSVYTNGAISVRGTLTSFSIYNSIFVLVGTGSNGGALYLNVNSFTNNENSVIESTMFGGCSALNGGAVFIGLSGITFFDVNFTNNTGSGVGNDVYFNSSSSQTFYSSSTVELCCSTSNSAKFALNDSSNLDSLISECEDAVGDRYVSSTDSFDDMNTCVNQNMPCRSISGAISKGVESGEQTVYIVVVGEYDDGGCTVGVGVSAHIKSLSEQSQS